MQISFHKDLWINFHAAGLVQIFSAIYFSIFIIIIKSSLLTSYALITFIISKSVQFWIFLLNHTVSP